jgi:hypothetical protein
MIGRDHDLPVARRARVPNIGRGRDRHLLARSRPAKPALEALKRASGVARSRKSPSSWSRRRKTAVESGVSGRGASTAFPRKAFWASSGNPWSRARQSIPAVGKATLACQRRATSMPSRSSAAGTNKPAKSCRAFITPPRCSSGGCLERFRAEFNKQHLDYDLDEFTFRVNRRRSSAGDCSFIILPNKPLPPVRRPTGPLFPADVL